MSVLRGNVLVLGYGNPGRQDDGLGPAAAAEVERLGLRHVRVQVNYQLNIEDAADAAESDWVVFLDAAEAGPEPFEAREIAPADGTAFTSHVVKPGVVLAICRDCFGRVPRALLVGIRGYEFELEESMTDRARANLERSAEYLRTLFTEETKP